MPVYTFSCVQGRRSTQPFTINLSEVIVHRSEVLQNAVDDEGGTGVIVLPHGATADFFDAWLAGIEKNDNADSISIQYLVRAIQAADFLADTAALEALCQALAKRIFVTSQTRNVGFSAFAEAREIADRALQQHGDSAASLKSQDLLMIRKGMEELKIAQDPPQVLDEIRGSEGETVSTGIRLGGIDETHSASRSLRSIIRVAYQQMLEPLSHNALLQVLTPGNVSLPHCVKLLPPALHPLALESQNPDIRMTHKLALPQAWNCSGQEIDILTAAAAHPCITSLSLGSGILSLSKEEDWVVDQCLYQLFSSLQNLKVLQVHLTNEAPVATALIQSLHAARGLTKVELHGPQGPRHSMLHSDESVIDRCARMPRLQDLRLDNYIVVDQRPFTRYCTLEQMTGITALVLKNCSLVDTPGAVQRHDEDDKGDARKDAAKNFSFALSELTQLKLLELNECSELLASQSVLSCISELGNLTSLALLNREDQRPSEHDVLCVVKAVLHDTLTSLTKLQSLALQGFGVMNQFRRPGPKYWPAVDPHPDNLKDTIPQLVRLRALRVLHDDVQHCHGIALLSLVKDSLLHLTLLDLSGNQSLFVQPRRSRETDVEHSLMESVRQLSSLQELRLAGCGIGPKCATLLAGVLLSLPGLTCLALNNNPMSFEGAQALAVSILELNQLQALYLSEKSVTERGLFVVREAFRSRGTGQCVDDSNILKLEG